MQQCLLSWSSAAGSTGATVQAKASASHLGILQGAPVSLPCPETELNVTTRLTSPETRRYTKIVTFEEVIEQQKASHDDGHLEVW